MRDRDRETETQTDTDRHRQRHRQTDRQTDEAHWYGREKSLHGNYTLTMTLLSLSLQP